MTDIEMQPIGTVRLLDEATSPKSPTKNRRGYFQFLRHLLPLVLIDVQTLASSHYDSFKKVFVTDHKWIQESVYNQAIDLIETIPGASTVQIVVALGTFSLKNAMGGILAVFCYSLPSAVILLLLGLAMRGYKYEEMNILIQIALYGVRAANVALIVQVCIKMMMDHIQSKLDIVLTVVSAVAVLLFPSPQTLLSMLLLGGLTMLMLEYDLENREDKIDEPQRRETKLETRGKYATNPNQLISIQNSSQFSILFGSMALHVYILVWILILWFDSQAQETNSPHAFIWDMVIIFYKIGTLIIGGTPVTLPFLHAEIVNNKLNISEDMMWIGFSLAAALPGPYLNFAIFLGAYTGGLEAGLACWFASYIPSLLQFWGLFPHWPTLKKNEYFSKFFEGVFCVAIGFMVASSYFAWANACKFDAQTATIISGLSLVYIVMLNFNSTGVMILGSILFIIRYLALWYYRVIDPALA